MSSSNNNNFLLQGTVSSKENKHTPSAAAATAATPTSAAVDYQTSSTSNNDQLKAQAQTCSKSQSSPQTVYPDQIHSAGGPAATAPFLQDFCLVAEAAKRAEMSVIMRDMEGISL